MKKPITVLRLLTVIILLSLAHPITGSASEIKISGQIGTVKLPPSDETAPAEEPPVQDDWAEAQQEQLTLTPVHKLPRLGEKPWTIWTSALLLVLLFLKKRAGTSH